MCIRDSPTDEAIGNVEVVTDGGAVLVSEYVETPSQVLELSASSGHSYYCLLYTSHIDEINAIFLLDIPNKNKENREKRRGNAAAPGKSGFIPLLCRS